MDLPVPNLGDTEIEKAMQIIGKAVKNVLEANYPVRVVNIEIGVLRKKEKSEKKVNNTPHDAVKPNNPKENK